MSDFFLFQRAFGNKDFPGGSHGKKSACSGRTWVQSLCWEDPQEKGMATHSSILAWRIPWTQEPGVGYSPWGRKETQLSDQHFRNKVISSSHLHLHLKKNGHQFSLYIPFDHRVTIQECTETKKQGGFILENPSTGERQSDGLVTNLFSIKS